MHKGQDQVKFVEVYLNGRISVKTHEIGKIKAIFGLGMAPI